MIPLRLHEGFTESINVDAHLWGWPDCSNLMNGQTASPILTANALEAVHVLLKPYQYFRNPGIVYRFHIPPIRDEEFCQKFQSTTNMSL